MRALTLSKPFGRRAVRIISHVGKRVDGLIASSLLELAPLCVYDLRKSRDICHHHNYAADFRWLLFGGSKTEGDTNINVAAERTWSIFGRMSRRSRDLKSIAKIRMEN